MMNERLREIRESLNLNQKDFSSKINIARSTLTLLENGQRSIKDIHISQVCSTFNVNENWFRYGYGDMFNAEISLDDFARMNNISELEIDIIKVYMRLDPDTRSNFISEMSKVFNKHSRNIETYGYKHSVNTLNESVVQEDDDHTYNSESKDDIEKEVERYRLELEAEKRAKTSGALESGKRKSKLG